MRVALAVVVLFAAVRARASVLATGFSESELVGGLTAPTAAAFLPDGRLLVTQAGGELVLVDRGSPRTVITLPVCTAPDGMVGLLGIAVHPDYPADRRIYLYRTWQCGPPAVNEVICVELAPGGTVDPRSLVVLLTDIRADTGGHNGGGLAIGPDRRLYVGVGDTGRGDEGRGPGTSSNPYAQDLGSLEGKILRLELDGSVPADNPFVAQVGARREIFAYGCRNPFRLAFDPANGRLWAGDVGEATVEEIDIVTAGGDYGWPRCEGTLPPGCEQTGDVDPVFSYPHTGSDSLGQAVIGGAFAERGAFAAFAGAYVFGDLGARNGPGAIYLATPNAARDALGAPAPVATDVEGPVDLVFGADGALYYVAYGAGAVRRIVPTSASPACLSIPECEADLVATLPDPARAASRAAGKVARALARLRRTAMGALARSAHVTGNRQRRQYARARHALARLLGLARRASDRGTLGVPLPPLESAGEALVALL